MVDCMSSPTHTTSPTLYAVPNPGGKLTRFKTTINQTHKQTNKRWREYLSGMPALQFSYNLC